MNHGLDPTVYSDQREWVADPETPEGGKFVPIRWKDLAMDRAKELGRLKAFARMVADLDRNENGRHEGDVDAGDPTGFSQGNPRLQTGDILGYNMRGKPYVMPDRGNRHNPDAWNPR